MKHTQRLVDFLLLPLSASRSALFVRLMAGGIFLYEGILKFVSTNQGVGRFTELGIPAPERTANFVASLEIVGGLLLIAGLFTPAIVVPFDTLLHRRWDAAVGPQQPHNVDSLPVVDLARKG